MDINAAFPSKWLRATDLQNRRYTVTISHVTLEDMGDGEHKPIIYFQGSQKGLACNKTNALEIATAYGDETDGWAGKQIELYPSMVMFQGRNTPCIRCRAIFPAAAAPLGGPVPQPRRSAPETSQSVGRPIGQGPGEQAAADAGRPFDDQVVIDGEPLPF